MVTIQKGIPIPPHANGRRKPSVYPIMEMKPGDSLAVGLAEKLKLLRAVNNFKYNHPGTSFVWIEEGEIIRVWRTK